MVSKNNYRWKQQQDAQRVPHYGLRKLSIGVASVLLSTTLYMGVNAHADTVTAPSESAAPTTTVATDSTTPTTTTEAVSSSSASSAGGEKSNRTNEVNESQAVPVNADSSSETAAQPVAATPAETEAPVAKPAVDGEAPKMAETVKPATMTWTIHYVNEGGTKLAPDTVISHDYQRTDTATAMGDYKYVDGSLKVTGTNNTGYHIDAPDFQYNQKLGDKVFDSATWQIAALSFDGYRPDYGSVAISDQLTKDPQDLGNTVHSYSGGEWTFHYTLNPKTVTINYVNDDDAEKIVSTGTVSGKPNTTVTITPVVPNGYMLNPKASAPTSYQVTDADNQTVTIHLQNRYVNVTDQQPNDQVNKTETLTRKHLYGPGPHEGEKFGEPDIVEVPWHRTATKDLVTDKISFGDWHVVWDEVKQVNDTATKMVADKNNSGATGWIHGALVSGYNSYSYLGAGSKTKAIATDGTVSNHNWYWTGEQDVEKYPTIVQYYGRGKVWIPVHYVDFDTNQQLTTKRLTGDDYLDGNTITFNKGDLTDWGTAVSSGYQLYSGQTLPTTYKIDTVTNNGALTPVTVYVVQPRTVQFTFVDNDRKVIGQHSQVGDAIPVTGTTGSTVPVSLTVPAGYKLVVGQQLPTTYTFVKDKQNQVILLRHQHVTVQPDAPKDTTDALPDNSSKTYPAGVSESDLNKTVTRTININKPDGSKTTEVQSVKLTRTADVDEVTGAVKHGDWTTGRWKRYLVPSLDGYDTDVTDNQVPAADVDSTTTDQTVEVHYNPLSWQTEVNYRDVNGNFIHTTTINGNTDQTVTVPNEVPAGWQVVSGQTVPSEITFGPNGHDPVTVKIEHQVTTSQEQKIITRNIKLTTITGDSLADTKSTTVKQTATISRTVTVDQVTHKTSYGDWSSAQWDAYQVPSEYGYQTNGGAIPMVTVTDQTKDQQLEIQKITLTRNIKFQAGYHLNVLDPVSVTRSYVRLVDRSGKEPVFNQWVYIPHSITVEHHPEDPSTYLQISPEAISHEALNTVKIEPADTPDIYHFNDITRFTTGVTPPMLINDGNTEIFTPIGGAAIDELPDGELVPMVGEDAVVQYDLISNRYEGVSFNRPITIHYADGSHEGQTINQTVQYTYHTRESMEQAGLLSADYTPLGSNDETYPAYHVTVPAGYEADQTDVPSEAVKFDQNNYGRPEDGTPVVITLTHKYVTVTPDQPQTDGAPLPDNPAKTFTGVSATDLTKTVTRTINIHDPHIGIKTTKQTVKLTRTATVDEVTGEVKYSDWTTGQWEAVPVPSVSGYQADMDQVQATAVTGDTIDTTVDATYQAQDQTHTIKYVDGQDSQTVVGEQTVSGKTDQTVPVTPTIPAGWELVNGQVVPSEVTLSADGDAMTVVKVQHRHVTVTPDDPKTPTDTLPDNPTQHYPSGVGESDLNKTVTRTINVTQPDGTTTKQVQTVKLTRTATVDEVTGEVSYDEWNTGQWDAYEIPSLNGYTASQTSVEATPVDENTTDQTVDVSYTPNKQSTTIKYVDNKGDVVHTTTVDGVTDQTVEVPAEVPTGWTITKGEVPNKITFGADGHEPVVVTVDHRHVTVTPDQPQDNGTKLPDNPAKTFNGVAANDLNKTITRTIKVTTPDGKTTTTKQEVKLTRTADVDEVTGEVKYGAWTTGQWDAYEVPSLNGYTASQASVDAAPVDEHTTDQTVNVSYTPNKQTTTIKYVDDKGDVVHTTTVDGVTDQTVKVPSEVPAGWMITKGHVPSEITFDVDGHEPIEVIVAHHHVTVDPEHPKGPDQTLPDNPTKNYPAGVDEPALNRIVERTIIVHNPDGTSKTVKQPTKLTRTADVDEVTGEVTYGKWSTGTWDTYPVPDVAGYVPNEEQVGGQIVTADTQNETINIYYTAGRHAINVQYVDDDSNGQVVKTETVYGDTDQTITITPTAPQGYKLVNAGSQTYIVTSDDGQTVQIHVKHHRVTTSESKTVARTINVHTPHDGVKTVKQTAELTRDVTTDQVTGEKTYDDWTTGQWESYTPKVVPGYTLSTNEVPNDNVDGSTGDQMVDVTYIADTQKVEIIYLDDTKGGSVVKTDQVTGKTDEMVKVTPDVPTGYELVGKVPGDYTMTADGHQTITVHLVHQTKTTSESKTIARTINVHTPHDSIKVVKQTATLTRAVTTDQVTDEKTYGDWSTTEWDHYVVPAVAGYVPSIEQVAQQVVNGTTTDQTIDVTYSSGEHTTHINYVDGDGNTVHTTTITGQTDGTVQVPNETPAGWTVVGEPVPNELTFGPDGHSDVTVTIDHQHVTVTPDQPKTPTDKLPDNPTKTYPNGVGHDDLNKTVVRTIKVTTPDGQTKTVEQTAHLTRTADVDEVTGEVTYGKWTTGEWSNYDVPTVPGYTPSQSEVPATKVTDATTDQTVTIGYTANDQATHVNYVDGDGKTVHTTTITGKTDQTVKVPNEVPTGWTVVGEPVPNELTFGPDGHADVTVTIDHQHVTVTPDKPQADGTKLPDNPALTFHGVGEGDLNRTVTRTITLNVPGQAPQVITQTIRLTRTATVDEVTGKVTYGDWSTGQWDAYEVPTVDGYTADQTTIPAVNVTSETTSQAIVIDYVAVPTVPTTPSNHQTDANQVTAATPNTPLQTPVTKAQKLPQTGETQNVLAPIGLALLGILSSFSLFAKKRKAGKDDKHQS